MITIRKACELAKKKMKGYTIVDCIDIGDKYVFSFAYNGELIPGTGMIEVERRSD